MNNQELIIEAGRTERHYWKDLWNYRELFYFLAWRDILVRYKQTIIGIIWAGLWPAMADRWAYIPLIGLFIIISWGSASIIKRWCYAKTWLIIMATGMLVTFTFVSWMQVHYWKNSMSLFNHAVHVNDNNFIAYDNLGLALVNNGNSDEALVCFSKSLK